MSRILVAVSDPEIRHTLQRLYHQVDYTFIETTDGDQALAAAAEEHPDVILLDIDLPETDSYTLCARLFATTRTPILMLIPDNVNAAESAFAAGASDVITKPVHLTTLHYRLRHFLQVSEVNVLVQQAEWYHSIVENALGAIYRSTEDGRFLFVNQAMVRMLGYDTIDEVLALKIPDEIYYDPRMRDIQGLELVTRNRVDEVEVVWKKKNGDPLTVRVYGRVIRDLQDQILYYEGIAFDISDWKRIEAAELQHRQLVEALRASAATLNNALDLNAVLDNILTCVRQVMPNEMIDIFLIENGTTRSVRRHGYVERGIDEFVENLRLKVTETPTFNEMVRSQRPLIIDDIRTFPGWVRFEGFDWARAFIGAPIHIEGKAIGFLTVDSTKAGTFRQHHADALQAFADQAGIAIHNARLYEASRHQAEQLEERVAERTAELEEGRVQLRAILDSISEGVNGTIFGEDTDTITYRYTNHALVELLGYNHDEWDIMALRPDNVGEAEYRNQIALIRKVTLEQGGWHGNIQMRHKDGHLVDLALSVMRVDDANGETIGAVSVYRDISQEKLLEARQARFVASAAHELRTPITSLKTRLYLAQAQPDKMDKHLPILERVLDQMQALLEDLLDLSRFENGMITLHHSRIELRPFIEDIVEIQGVEAELKGIRLLTDFQSSVPYINADLTRLHQVVTNLLTNAIQHTSDGAQITLRIFSTTDEADKPFRVIEIEDTGEGIPPEHLPHIFEPFYRANRSRGKGMGLGLSISKEIVELHGGKLLARSEVGKGTTFSIWLPDGE